jgi:hypothetical protein
VTVSGLRGRTGPDTVTETGHGCGGFLVAWASSPRMDHQPSEKRPHGGQDAHRTMGSVVRRLADTRYRHGRFGGHSGWDSGSGSDRGSDSDRYSDSGQGQHRPRHGHGHRVRYRSRTKPFLSTNIPSVSGRISDGNSDSDSER